MTDEYTDMLQELDRWFDAYSAPYAELTEAELEELERKADTWLMGCTGVL